MPMNTPGITLQKLNLIGEHDINAMFLDDVRIPVENCVGGENKG
jgi:alkylation response protein AidB-like acyl-CoA dehydrogenase